MNSAKDARGIHVVSKAGFIRNRPHTRREGAVSVTTKQPHDAYHIRLHDDLVMTSHYCPASGTLLGVDFHRKDDKPLDDVVIAADQLQAMAKAL